MGTESTDRERQIRADEREQVAARILAKRDDWAALGVPPSEAYLRGMAAAAIVADNRDFHGRQVEPGWGITATAVRHIMRDEEARHA